MLHPSPVPTALPLAYSRRPRPAPAIGVQRASTTLVRASRFLGEQAWFAGEVPSRWLGNAMAELDGFLHVLLDECAAALAPEAFDHRAFARRRNAAGKLGEVQGWLGLEAHDLERLRAIGRLRGRLRQGGAASARGRATGFSWRVTPGELGPADLPAICRCYGEVARTLVRSLPSSGSEEMQRDRWIRSP